MTMTSCNTIKWYKYYFIYSKANIFFFYYVWLTLPFFCILFLWEIKSICFVFYCILDDKSLEAVFVTLRYLFVLMTAIFLCSIYISSLRKRFINLKKKEENGKQEIRQYPKYRLNLLKKVDISKSWHKSIHYASK